MTISLITLLIALIIVAVLLYCARLLIAAFGVPQPLATVIYVVLILICLLIVLQSLGIFGRWGVMTIP